jgi:Holliday junction DNA helicase RuvA
MIGYLKGTVANIQKSTSSRTILILEANNIGYELQVPSRLAQQLPMPGETVQVFTHLQVREDHMVLYGFGSAAERDLFRQLLTVSGIGSQMAIALLDTHSLADLVQAIITSNISTLAKTPGVGSKKAELIALTLKKKLGEWRTSVGLTTADNSSPAPAIREDVEMTLLALGYSSDEVSQALHTVSQDAQVAESKNAEEWIRSAIAWLSR